MIFETQDGADVTAKIDASSISKNLGVTVGPANAGFDESLDYVASDLARTLKEFVDERGVAPPQRPPHKGESK